MGCSFSIPLCLHIQGLTYAMHHSLNATGKIIEELFLGVRSVHLVNVESLILIVTQDTFYCVQVTLVILLVSEEVVDCRL